MLPLAAMLVVLMGGAAGLLWTQYQERVNGVVDQDLWWISRDLEGTLVDQALGLKGAIAPIAADKPTRQALRDRDAVQLLRAWRTVFESLRNENRVTHFYFMDPGRVCLLRLHAPEKHGDTIDRFTARKAERTRAAASGIELGPLGTFTLRAVQPVLEDGVLLGYVELGKEIEDVLEDVQSRFGRRLALILDKKHLSRPEWERGMKAMGRAGNWDRLAQGVINYPSDGQFPAAFDAAAQDALSGIRRPAKAVSVVEAGGEVWHVSTERVQDASGATVGSLLVLSEITDIHASFVWTLWRYGVVAVALLAAFLYFVAVLLRRTDASLRAQQAALRQSNERLAQLAEQSRTLVWEIDANGLYTYVSGVSAQLLGYSPEEMVGRMFFYDLHPAQGREAFKSAAFKVFAQKKSFANVENPVVTKDGRGVWLSTNGIPVLDTNGELLGYRGSDTDITERRRTEEELKESATRLRLAVRAGSVGIWDYDVVNNALVWDDQMYQLYGITPDRFSGAYDAWRSGLHPEDRLRGDREIRQALLGEKDFDTEFRVVWPGGTVRHVRALATVIRDAGGKPLRMVGTNWDITEEKNAEEEIRNARAQYQSLVENIPGITYRCKCDKDWTMLFMSDAVNALIGFPASDFVGNAVRTYESVIHRDDTDFVAKAIHAAIAENRAWDIEYRVRRRDGDIRWVQERGRAIYGEDGRVDYLDGFILDSTEQKSADIALARSREQFMLAVQGSNDGIWDWDLRDNSLFLSARWKEMLGYTEAELADVFSSFEGLLHPDDRPRVLKYVRQYLQKGEGHYEAEFRMRHKDGSYRWILARGQAVRDASGAAIRMAGSHTDVTERKTAEQRLVEDRQRLASVIQGANVGTWEWNVQTGQTVFNDIWARMVGYTLEELAPVNIKTWEALTHAEDLPKAGARLEAHFAGAEPFYECQLRMKHKQGHWVWIHDRGQVIRRTDDGKPLMMFGTHTDISAQKDAEQELREMNEALERQTLVAKELAAQAQIANSAKSEFLANMSHEIRTPMNGVIGMTGLLLDTPLNDEQRRYAEIVRDSAESLLSLINDILDFSKIEAGKMCLEVLDFDLQELLDDFAASLALRAHEKGLELVCGVDSDVPARLRGDSGRLRQVLNNLAGNAVKFTPKGEVSIRVQVESGGEDSVALRFTVRDTGIGIPPAKLGILFDKFTQADASTTRQYGGSGLGLAISKQLVEMMGGQIGVVSEEGRGSEFWFAVRLARQKNPLAEEPAPDAALKGVRALVVDDNATSREILVKLLSSWEMRPSEATGAGEGLLALGQAVQEGDPFLLALVDMQMPGMDGEALGAAIRADKRLDATRLVMLTSLGVRGGAGRCAAIGFYGCLTKPVRRQDLRNLLSLAMRGQKGPEPVQVPSAAANLPGRFAGRKARILLAEDNTTNQQVALGILRRLGLHADAVANGREAVRALQTIPYDLALMDVQMPELDGLQAARIIRKGSSPMRHVPIIAMTAHAMQGDRERCLEAGMNDYVVKPVSPRALADALDRWLPVERGPAADARGEAPVAPPMEPGAGGASVWDKAGMLDRLMGDVELAGAVLEAFLGDMPEQICRMEAALARGDLATVQRQAHSIKGAAANAGAGALRSAALEVEQSASARRLAGVTTGAGRLRQEMSRVADAIRSELPSLQGGSSPSIEEPGECAS